MKFEVEMQAFQGGVIREVDVPDNELTGNVEDDLERIFYWGQNDFAPVPNRCSVSADDVIRYKGKRYKVDFIGFSELIEPVAVR